MCRLISSVAVDSNNNNVLGNFLNSHVKHLWHTHRRGISYSGEAGALAHGSLYCSTRKHLVLLGNRFSIDHNGKDGFTQWIFSAENVSVETEQNPLLKSVPLLKLMLDFAAVRRRLAPLQWG